MENQEPDYDCDKIGVPEEIGHKRDRLKPIEFRIDSIQIPPDILRRYARKKKEEEKRKIQNPPSFFDYETFDDANL